MDSVLGARPWTLIGALTGGLLCSDSSFGPGFTYGKIPNAI